MYESFILHLEKSNKFDNLKSKIAMNVEQVKNASDLYKLYRYTVPYEIKEGIDDDMKESFNEI